MQIVSQLELQLTKEKDRLQGMMKHLQLEQTSNGELKPLQQQSNNNENNPLQMLQSSVDRASDLNQKIMTSEENQRNKSSPENQAEFSSRMAAMAAMFPNLPSSITASLAFPSSQSKSPLNYALNHALMRTKGGTIAHKMKRTNKYKTKLTLKVG